jgi:hypothetical protein
VSRAGVEGADSAEEGQCHVSLGIAIPLFGVGIDIMVHIWPLMTSMERNELAVPFLSTLDVLELCFNRILMSH